MQQEFTDDRPAKRQRVDPPPAWNVVRTARPTAAQSRKEVPLWARTADSAKQKKKVVVQNGQRTLATQEVIDLCEDTEEPPDRFLPGFSSDALAPSSPPPPANVARIAQTLDTPSVRSSSPAFQTQAMPANVRKAATIDSRSGAESRTDSREPETSTRTRTTLPESVPVEKVHKPRSERNDGPVHSTALQNPEKRGVSRAGQSSKTEAHPSRTLRVAASSSKKRTLLCQDQLLTKNSRFSKCTQ